MWGASGVVTAAVIAAPATVAIEHAGLPGNPFGTGSPVGVRRTLTVSQPVSALTMVSNGAMVRIAAGDVSRVEITETITPGKGPAGGMASVTDTVSGGGLTLTNAACVTQNCAVAFTITVPASVTADISSQGGPVIVSGVPGARIDSGGGPVTASQIGGPLTATTEGGPLVVNGLTGTLDANTGGGTAIVQGASDATASIDTEGGPAIIGFATPPRAVTVQTGGGMARIDVPGGPYALTADSGGGPESVEVVTSPSAPRSLTVDSGGGPLTIG